MNWSKTMRGSLESIACSNVRASSGVRRGSVPPHTRRMYDAVTGHTSSWPFTRVSTRA